MSKSQTVIAETSVEEISQDRDTQGQSLRFTPLRSYVTRARALGRETHRELSRLNSVPRFQN
jgi:hypothetical protein